MIEEDFEVCWKCQHEKDGTVLRTESAVQSETTVDKKPDTNEIIFDLGCLAESSGPTHTMSGTRHKETWLIRRMCLPRPATGKKLESLKCRTCKKTLHVEVISQKAVSRLRIKSAAVGSALLAFMVVVYATVQPGTISILEGVLMLAAFLSIFALIGAVAVVFGNEFGLAINVKNQQALEWMEFGRHLHKVFEPQLSKPQSDALPYSRSS
jgi:hypothetical protein